MLLSCTRTQCCAAAAPEGQQHPATLVQALRCSHDTTILTPPSRPSNAPQLSPDNELIWQKALLTKEVRGRL
jgi:hypothetical protein